MKLLILPDAAAAAARVVDEIRDLVDQKPEARLGLATGGTMEPVYAALAAAVARGDCDGRRQIQIRRRADRKWPQIIPRLFWFSEANIESLWW